MTASIDDRLSDLEQRLANFAQDHRAANSAAIAGFEARLAQLRTRLSDHLAQGKALSAIGDEFERDTTGLSEEMTALIIDSGRT